MDVWPDNGPKWGKTGVGLNADIKWYAHERSKMAAKLMRRDPSLRLDEAVALADRKLRRRSRPQKQNKNAQPPTGRLANSKAAWDRYLSAVGLGVNTGA